MNGEQDEAGFACRMSCGTAASRSRLRYRKKAMIAERDDDRQDRPRLAQPLTERDLRDLGRFVLERVDERIRARDAGSRRRRWVWPPSHRTLPDRPSRRPPDDGPARPDRSRSAGPSRRPTSAGGSGRDPAIAADVIDALGDRCPEPDQVARPARDDLARSAASASRPAGVDGIAIERGVGDADLHHRMRVRDRDPRQAVLERERLRRPRCHDRRAARCASRPSRPAARDSPSPHRAAATRAAESNGCGIPTRPPCSRAAAIVSTADSPGGIARSRNRQIRSPSSVLTSSPTITVKLGRRELPSLERDVDPVMVRDREMRQSPGVRRLDDVPRLGQAIEAAPRVAMQIRERPGHVSRGPSPGASSSWVPHGCAPNGAPP